MADKNSIQPYRRQYAILLRLYSKPYYHRFAEAMEQTFADLLHERLKKGKQLFTYVLWIFFETFLKIIKENINTIFMRRKHTLYIALGTIAILLIPLIAMQFTSEVQWTAFDFIIAGVVLFGTGVAYEFISSRGGNAAYRGATAMAVMTALFLFWVTGAVGIIGDEGHPANLLHLGVILIEFLGVIIARLRPKQMAYALFTTAGAMTVVPIIAFIIWPPSEMSWGSPGVFPIIMLNTFFAAAFLASGLLYRQSASKNTQA